MTLESVLECDKENQTLPSVSRAAIMDSLGLTVLSFTLPSPFLGAHTFRMKLDSLSQVSSMLMILVLLSRSGSIRKAYCYLSTRDFSVLVPTESFLALTKLSLQSCLSTWRACLLLTSMSNESLTCWRTICKL